MAFKLPDEPLYWRGATCLMIGLFIVLGPHIMRSAMWINLLGQSQAVGWFALVLGCAADAPVAVDDAAFIDTSFPGFALLMRGLGAEIA